MSSMVNKKPNNTNKDSSTPAVNPVVQAYEMWWRLSDEIDKPLDLMEKQIELIRKLFDKKLKEIDRLLPEDHYPSHVKLDADGLLQRKATRKKT